MFHIFDIPRWVTVSRSLPRVIWLLAVFVLWGLSGCQTSPSTGLRIEVLFDPALGLDQLRVALRLVEDEQVAPDPRLVPESPELLDPGLRLLLLVPENWSGSTARVTVDGLVDQTETAHGDVQAQIVAGEVLDRKVTLLSSCTSECSLGETTCHNNQVRLCETFTEGCLRFGPPMDCPETHPFCSQGACSETCTSECSEVGVRRCKASGFQTCIESAPGCLIWGPDQSCGPTEICRPQDGQCVLDCGGEPCPCQQGETLPCADVGQCTDGVRHCEAEGFGACNWKQGPTVEVCDGQDNDCSGTADDNLVAPACAKQQGVCKNAVQTCAGAGGWQACGSTEYSVRAQANGLTYEANESLCDGQDNDCDGDSDEPGECCQPQCSDKACGADDGCGHPCLTGSCSEPQHTCQAGSCVCQPSCSGKACGADDGCGGSCQSGSCPANSSCVAGQCTCDFVDCTSGCCASGQSCVDGSCCTPECAGKECGPDGCDGECGQCTGGETCSAAGTCEPCQQDCSGRECGPDPVCGQSCGPCDAGEQCNADGQCVDGSSGTWNEIASSISPSNDLSGVSCVPSAGVWVTGLGGSAVFDGSLWTNHTSVLGEDVWASALDDAWVVGYTNLKHFDGSGWSTQATPASRSVLAIHGCSKSRIWAVGSGGARILYTGSSWMDAGYGSVGYLYDVWCEANNYWAVGGTSLTTGNILTNSGGPSKVDIGPYLYGIWADGAGGAWAVGDGGTILKYESGQWYGGSSPTSNTLKAIWGASPTDIWAVGQNGTIVHYDGSQWSKQTSPTTETLQNIQGCSSTDIWAVGNKATILHFF